MGKSVNSKLGENRQRMLEAMTEEPTISIVAMAELLGMSSTAIEKISVG